MVLATNCDICGEEDSTKNLPGITVIREQGFQQFYHSIMVWCWSDGSDHICSKIQGLTPFSVLCNWELHSKAGTWKREAHHSCEAHLCRPLQRLSWMNDIDVTRWFNLSVTKIYHYLCSWYTQCSVASWRDDDNFTSAIIFLLNLLFLYYYTSLILLSTGRELSRARDQYRAMPVKCWTLFLNGWLKSIPQGWNLSFMAYLNHSK